MNETKFGLISASRFCSASSSEVEDCAFVRNRQIASKSSSKVEKCLRDKCLRDIERPYIRNNPFYNTYGCIYYAKHKSRKTRFSSIFGDLRVYDHLKGDIQPE